ncbi:IS3 family transposase [Streptomyces sp. NBC_00233]|uniref:IS3 family transposase n=1 Tax=Streptomyces sp. NBC_00233 TaxID=2975686 RepID=UPI00224FD307|nr:IS3 family transposase [Streptomyces sp. NBC_00233]MCX5233225.1 IS3 family transposase [Streptomyces sp. NBC_00233]
MTALVDEHPRLGVECVLRELHIPSSTYYRWRRAEREPCERRRRDTELTEHIRRIHTGSGGIYGSPRIHAQLRQEGVHVGRKRVERLMRQADLQGISPRPAKGFTRRDPGADLADDLVQRDFTAPAPNRLWVTDLTMIPTHEGPLWLSAIRDAFSRRVVAWETSARADADLVLTVLEYALASREVAPGELIHHADHGCQGGFNRSSQHLVIMEVSDGSSSAGSGSGGTAEAEVSGASEVPAACRGGVLDGDREGPSCRGGRGHCRRGAGRRDALVPPVWRYATVRCEALFGQVPVVS